MTESNTCRQNYSKIEEKTKDFLTFFKFFDDDATDEGRNACCSLG